MSEPMKRGSKVEIWRAHVAAQAASGQTIRAFCEARGLTAHCLEYWKKRFRKDAMKASAASRFIAVDRSAQPVPIPRPRIRLPNGVEIDLGESLSAAGVQTLLFELCGVNRARA